MNATHIVGILVFSAMIFHAVGAAADPSKLAIFPPVNAKELNKAEADALHATICESAMDGNEGSLALIPREKTSRAAGKKRLDATTAAKAAKRVDADMALLVKISEVGGTLRATIEVISVESETVLGLTSARGEDFATLEDDVAAAVSKALEPLVDRASAPSGESLLPPEVGEEIVFSDIAIDAIGTRKHRPEEGTVPVEAEVYINGRRVGKTPFEDGLPPGEYLFEMKAFGQIARKSTVLDRDTPTEFTASFDIPMTSQEKAAAEEERRERERARRAEAKAFWQENHDAWQEKNDAVMAKRKPMLGAGITMIVLGPCLLITGIAFEVAAAREDDIYRENKTQWLNSVDPDDIADAKSDMDAAANARTTNNAVGIVTLVVGGASLITGIILAAKAPKKLEEPKLESYLSRNSAADVKVFPVALKGGVGLGMDVRF